MKLLTVDFARTVLIAGLVAMPIAYLLMEEWLSNYAVRINVNAWVFLIAIIAILVLAMTTVSFQTIKTATENPTNSLKQE